LQKKRHTQRKTERQTERKTERQRERETARERERCVESDKRGEGLPREQPCLASSRHAESHEILLKQGEGTHSHCAKALLENVLIEEDCI
jgi:hypothetical protein